MLFGQCKTNTLKLILKSNKNGLVLYNLTTIQLVINRRVSEKRYKINQVDSNIRQHTLGICSKLSNDYTISLYCLELWVRLKKSNNKEYDDSHSQILFNQDHIEARLITNVRLLKKAHPWWKFSWNWNFQQIKFCCFYLVEISIGNDTYQ